MCQNIYYHLHNIRRIRKYLSYDNRKSIVQAIIIKTRVLGWYVLYLDLIKIKESSRYQLRSYRGILLMDNTYRTKKTLGDRAFENAAPKVWNRLPLEIRQC
ncbi:unnamed protein product, partial [Pocillopora meandrina]